MIAVMYGLEMSTELGAIHPEVLGGLSPYRTSHINRFGDYTLDLERKVAPLQFTEIVLEPHGTQIAEPRG